MTEPKVKCISMGDQKILLIDWGNKKVIRFYYPTGYGNYYFDEIEFDGETFVARSGVASDVKLTHKSVKWEQRYKPAEHNGAVMYFDEAFKEPWWDTFERAWKAVTSLCPVTIP